MKVVTYKIGMTTLWSDGEKVIIKNDTGSEHVRANVTGMLGEGEFDKLKEVAISETYKPGTRRFYELVSNYIPAKVQERLGVIEPLKDEEEFKKRLPGLSDSDLVEKYFK